MSNRSKEEMIYTIIGMLFVATLAAFIVYMITTIHLMNKEEKSYREEIKEYVKTDTIPITECYILVDYYDRTKTVTVEGPSKEWLGLDSDEPLTMEQVDSFISTGIFKIVE